MNEKLQFLPNNIRVIRDTLPILLEEIIVDGKLFSGGR
jgi:hypothetical protein